MRVAIIGAGPAHSPDGMTLALACRRAGFATTLEDVFPGNLRRAVSSLREEDRPFAPQLARSVEDAVRDADLIMDTVPDELESKLEIFSLLDRMAPPRALLLTPTRTLSIADLAACTYRPGLCFGLQFGRAGTLWNVRVTAPPAADASTVERVCSFFKALGAEVRTQRDSSAG